ncbi:MocR-like pyridoxine biosynthesis transcription factor PdxR [Achromobacter xylosoxidans]|jgi:GntR family transcriptional regulator/MocR family aminotransferase|uniref:PLP-dependent aminotransferase family protein n=1 Tax=Bordetella hinzii TaxID=103855 RepID=A0AAN1VHT1_9BORD|nr:MULTISPECIES: PLP-dependent aminotransferase family protein [Alcaligenaceae]AKQ59872.1 HTH-type transcriptional regulatory protein GabR [Bordetella hinzii]AOB25190.1 GntR family transcriptional regulator [Bordetella bronchiseptica]AZW19015.1 PLP-dependent aminotransferase family protein [Bordetella hinzii]AZW42435.1 PLP-dependent aminotransferase family protein [Bordetella bronchiseptica]KCB42037.1 transcriptional regulator, GntR family [Bordetella hinzii 4161]
MTDLSKFDALSIQVDRAAVAAIGDQIHASLRQAILDGRLAPGQRLPSGRDLAAQLGVARGTIRVAYDRLIAENLVFGAGPAGTRVSARPPTIEAVDALPIDRPLAAFNRPFSSAPRPFQMGVPAHDAFPAKLWARMRARALRDDAITDTAYADPRGEPVLRAQIASHLAISRQMQCHPDQIIVTGGYRQGLLLALTALRAQGRKAWIEEPGYPLGRRGLELIGATLEPVAVDAKGLRVDDGIARAPDALLALVTPGQHAPLGVTLSRARRHALLDWAASSGAWIIEDDYLGELQLDGRAAPALASGAGAERVIHIGSFSKTLSPALGLGFVVAPRSLAERLVEVAAVLAPAPNRIAQLAVSEFLSNGHFLRHLRQMKALYTERRNLALTHVNRLLPGTLAAGLGVIAPLPQIADDIAVVRAARAHGLAPSALSAWHLSRGHAQRGLLLSVTNLHPDNIETACATLARIVASH